MDDLKFRDLRADEIDVRISQINEKGCTLLLYKDARCDMNILDETVGSTNWQRSHTRDNANCIVSIWDASKEQWIAKEDTGKESYTEKEKGLASDSFKRACFNWGIGRELYTAPRIRLWADSFEIRTIKNKPGTYDTFAVDSIKIENHAIKALKIKRFDSKERDCGVVFEWSDGKKKSAPKVDKKETPPVKDNVSEDIIAEIRKLLKETGKSEAAAVKYYNAERIENLTGKQAADLIRILVLAKKKKAAQQKPKSEDGFEESRRELEAMLDEVG